MSQSNYTITYYGIAIPIDSSELYTHVLKQLASKYPEYYQEVYEDELDFLNIFDFTNVSYEAEDIGIITLAGEYKDIYTNNILILIGDHEYPNLYSSPFKSKKDCINHYKKQFGDILPKDFNYENNIGKISYVTWG